MDELERLNEKIRYNEDVISDLKTRYEKLAKDYNSVVSDLNRYKGMVSQAEDYFNILVDKIVSRLN